MEEIRTDAAPEPLGPYSQAIKDGDTIYVAGQGPADPESREVEVESVRDQTAQTMENIGAILEAAGTSLDNLVNATVYLGDMDDYDAVNEVYGEYLSDPYPARAAIQIVDFPSDIKVEIQAVATLRE